ncbi:MAG: hypothetical protein KME42_14175 [Tildeniella nuda ZEHNDER 1965/U140]|jgi:hypothetical protein|nr:hypothetical protein [Tildeniella nuda ZEHNDER 1965/U140]
MQKRIKLLNSSDRDFHYGADRDRIVRIFQERGYSISAYEARSLWEQFSEMMAAGWMSPPEDDEEVFNSVKTFFEVEEATDGES